MYALVIVFAVMSSALPVGVTSQIVGHFENLDQCKEVASKPVNGGAIADLNLSQGVYWHCVYTGTR
jgi:hypothetical protein